MTATKEEEEENGSSFSSVELETKEKKEEELEDKEGNEEEEEEGNYFGKLAKEGKAPPGTNPFAFSSAVVDDAEEETKKMIEEAKKQTEKQREQREKVEREEREKERLAAENRGLEFTPRTKAGGETTTTTKKEVVRRKVVRAKRPTPKSDAEDGGLGKTKPNPFASLVPGGAKKADESKGQKEDAPHTKTSAQQKGNVFSRLSKKGGDDEKKTTTAAAEKKTPRRDPESRRKEKQPRQETPTPTTAEQQPGLALFPGLAKFKDADDETKKPPSPKGGAGVFSGFSGFAPKPPSNSAEQEHPSSSSLFKPSLFAKELGVTCTPEEIRPVTCARASAFAKDILDFRS